MFEIAGLSVKYPAKKDCGDAIYHETTDTYVMMLLADGVSSCSNDHLASRKTLEFYVESFNKTTGSLEKRLSEAVKITSVTAKVLALAVSD